MADAATGETREKDNSTPPVDVTTLPIEVLVHVLDLGGFSHRELARLRLVSRAFCAAASVPLLHRDMDFGSLTGASFAAAIEALPEYIAQSLARVHFWAKSAADLAVLGQRCPNLVTLTVSGGDPCENTAGLPDGLRRLRLMLGPRQDCDTIDHLSNLECLFLRGVTRSVPLASLPCLRRLGLQGAGEYDPTGLVAAAAASPCAATLEMLTVSFNVVIDPVVGWWAGLADLPRLREFCLCARSRSAFATPDDADGFAALLASLSALRVLDLTLSADDGDAVVRHGFPDGLRVLRLAASSPFWSCLPNIFEPFGSFLPSVPASTVVFCLEGCQPLSAADVGTLLAQCPKLRAIAADLEPQANAVLVAAAGNRSLFMDRRPGHDDLAAAGHTVGFLVVEVDWLIPGGVTLNSDPLKEELLDGV